MNWFEGNCIDSQFELLAAALKVDVGAEVEAFRCSTTPAWQRTGRTSREA